MQRLARLLLLILIAGTAVLVLHAQPAPQKQIKDVPLPIGFLAPYIPPVPGAPVTVEYSIRVEQPRAGSSKSWHTVTQAARDSNGRVRFELHEYLPASTSAEPRLISLVLTDPVARLRHTLDPVAQTDDREWFHPPHAGQAEPTDWAGQDLGSKNVHGSELTGKRRAWTLTPHLGDSGPPARVVDETWYSKDLHLIVAEQQADSSGGVITISLSVVNRGEPPASLFVVPRGYHVLKPRGHADSGWQSQVPGADWEPFPGSSGIPSRPMQPPGAPH